MVNLTRIASARAIGALTVKQNTDEHRRQQYYAGGLGHASRVINHRHSKLILNSTKGQLC
jgi:hypothetical protein